MGCPVLMGQPIYIIQQGCVMHQIDYTTILTNLPGT
jgi:hypothetical protein